MSATNPYDKVRPFDQEDLRRGGKALTDALTEATAAGGKLDVYPTVLAIFRAADVISSRVATAEAWKHGLPKKQDSQSPETAPNVPA
jgi:hypothetical protein